MKKNEVQKALTITFFTGIALMLWGLLFSTFTKSNIIELDANAYIICAIVDIVTIIVARLQNRKHTKVYPLGYGGYIPLINLVRNVLLILICIQAFTSSVYNLFYPDPVDDHKILFLYVGVTFLINQAIYFYINRKAKQTKSPLLITDAMEWKVDKYFNLSIMVVFGISLLIHSKGFTSISMYLDPIVCLILACFLIITPLKMIIGNVKTITVTSVEPNLAAEIIKSFQEKVPTLHEVNAGIDILIIANYLWINILIKEHAKLTSEELLDMELAFREIVREKHEHHRVVFYFSES